MTFFFGKCHFFFKNVMVGKIFTLGPLGLFWKIFPLRPLGGIDFPVVPVRIILAKFYPWVYFW